MKNFVSYLRVSTQRQGASGLGLEAQREIIKQSVGSTVAEFVEVESGRKTERPALHAALAVCRRDGCTLVVAKLDRLARNLNFLTALLSSDVEIFFCDFPQANKMVLHIIGAIAQYEAELISQRTRAALEAKKAQGTKLGKPENLMNVHYEAVAKSNETNRAKWHDNANNRRATAYLLTLPKMTLREYAERLNADGFCTGTGKPFHGSQVGRLLARAGA